MIKLSFEVDENGRIINNKNRGMSLEQEINETNEYYIENNIALVHKKATPITIVKCNDNKITEAYFNEKSTTDYNGCYEGIYIDFEAKSTIKKASFPLANILPNQIEQARNVLKQKGVSFFLVEFSELNRYFVLPSKILLNYIDNTITSSIPLKFFEDHGYELIRQLNPPLDYIEILKYHLSDFLE